MKCQMITSQHTGRLKNKDKASKFMNRKPSVVCTMNANPCCTSATKYPLTANSAASSAVLMVRSRPKQWLISGHWHLENRKTLVELVISLNSAWFYISEWKSPGALKTDLNYAKRKSGAWTRWARQALAQLQISLSPHCCPAACLLSQALHIFEQRQTQLMQTSVKMLNLSVWQRSLPFGQDC